MMNKKQITKIFLYGAWAYIITLLIIELINK